MPKARDYQLNDVELQAVETAIRRDKRPEVRQRCTAIRLLHLGYKPAQVAKLQAVSIPTIYAWIKRWQQGGIEALATQPRSGRPRKADAAYCQLLGEVLEKEPAELGYRFTVWTIDRLRAHLAQETGIVLSESRFRALLQREGFRYRRPKYALNHLQDPEAKAQAEELLEGLKKSAPRRFQAHLYGRNDPEPGSTAARLLDESRTAETGPGNLAWAEAKTAWVWRL